MLVKVQRLALVMAALVCAVPASAEEMRADEARHFIAGKHFAYNCFDGTNGNGRIYPTVRSRATSSPAASGPRRYVVLPTGTLRTKRRPLLRVAPRPAVRALLQSRPHQPGELPRLGLGPGLRLLQFREAQHARGSAARTDLSAARRPRLGGRRRIAAASQSSPSICILDVLLNLNRAHGERPRDFLSGAATPAVGPPHHARGWSAEAPLKSTALRRARPERRARASRRSIAAILHPGAVLPGADGAILAALVPAAFAPVRPSRVQQSKADPRSWVGRCRR